MKKTREEVLEDVLQRVSELSEDIDDYGDIGEDTYLLGNMNWGSIDIVVLANDVQDQYGQVLPFTELFEEIAEREPQDLSIGEFVDFVYKHVNSVPA